MFYTQHQMANLWVKAGGDPGLAAKMAAIATAESGGRQHAYNGTDPYGGSYGLWQINGVHPFASSRLMQDALYNAQAAVYVLRRQGFHAWSTYSSGAWKHYYHTNLLVLTGGTHARRVSVTHPKHAAGLGTDAHRPGDYLITPAEVARVQSGLRHVHRSDTYAHVAIPHTAGVADAGGSSAAIAPLTCMTFALTVGAVRTIRMWKERCERELSVLRRRQGRRNGRRRPTTGKRSEAVAARTKTWT